jgi:ankyrin repeat protein
MSAAAEEGICDVLTLLLDGGANVDARDTATACTPLHCAAGRGHCDAVKLLLKRGATVDATDADGWTPLHWAADASDCGAHDTLSTVDMLLKHGATVDVVDHSNRTPLMLAQDTEVADALQRESQQLVALNNRVVQDLNAAFAEQKLHD